MFKLKVLSNINMDGQSVCLSTISWNLIFQNTESPHDRKFGALSEYSGFQKKIVQQTFMKIVTDEHNESRHNWHDVGCLGNTYQ